MPTPPPIESTVPFQTAAPGSRVWILDDDEVLCELLKQRLARESWRVRTFQSPEEFETALVSQSPDLLVLDEMLPVKPGTQLLHDLRLYGHLFPVLMLSALAEPHHRLAGLEVGADDYLGKPFLTRELQLRIERLLTRTAAPLSARRRDLPRFTFADLRFDAAARTLESAAGEVLSLTPGETAFLLAFCLSEGQTLSRERLIVATGSLVDAEQSRSVDVRIAKLRRRLQQLSGRNNLIESERGRGYRLNPNAGLRVLEHEEKR
jgi:DNA-binding response OmpR family regulator